MAPPMVKYDHIPIEGATRYLTTANAFFKSPLKDMDKFMQHQTQMRLLGAGNANENVIKA